MDIVPYRPAARSPYWFAAFRLSSRMTIRWAGRADACVCVVIMDCLICTYDLLATASLFAPRLTPHRLVWLAARREEERVLVYVDIVDCSICIYDLPRTCYSIGVEREQTERTTP